MENLVLSNTNPLHALRAFLHLYHSNKCYREIISLLPLSQIVTNKNIKPNGIQRRREFQKTFISMKQGR